MKTDKSTAKGKILQAVLALIAEGEDASLLTTRQIAAKAGVNTALVNYHYQSKENLLSQAVGTMMGGIIGRIAPDSGGPADAESRLRDILTETADAAFLHENICKIALSTELKQGCRNSCAMVMPFLKELFGERSQQELDILALQLMLPFHHIALNPQLYGALLGVDFYDERQRKQKINQMIDCVLAGAKTPGKEKNPA